MSGKVKLTLSQIEVMKHALGFEPDRIGKDMRYSAHRNYYVAGEEDNRWENLITKIIVTGNGLKN